MKLKKTLKAIEKVNEGREYKVLLQMYDTERWYIATGGFSYFEADGNTIKSLNAWAKGVLNEK